MRDSGLVLNLVRWGLSALALIATSYIIPGFRLKNFGTALVAAAIIGFANIFIRPGLLFLTFPINVLTLGLFTFVVNGCVLKMSAAVLQGFEVRTWFAAIFGAVVTAFINVFFEMLLFGTIPF